MSYVIRLTTSQQRALLLILVDHARREDATQEWIDVVNKTTTTLDDLLTLVATANWEGER